jgi:hypothetical protein
VKHTGYKSFLLLRRRPAQSCPDKLNHFERKKIELTSKNI